MTNAFLKYKPTPELNELFARGPIFRIDLANNTLVVQLELLRDEAIAKRSGSMFYRASEEMYMRPEDHIPDIITAMLEHGQVYIWKFSMLPDGIQRPAFGEACEKIAAVPGVEIIPPRS